MSSSDKTCTKMFSKTRVYDSTPPVLVLMALFVFGLMAMLPPSCQCPRGFTYSQCNFTNMVCLTQTMFVKGHLQEPTAHPSIRERKLSAASLTTDNARNTIISKTHGKHPVKPGVRGNVDKERNADHDPKFLGIENSIRHNLLLYNSYPVILFVIAGLMSLPSLIWRCAAVEKDIQCIRNTVTYAGSETADEKSRQKCIDQCVSDIKFFIRYFHETFYKNVRRIYILKICIPLFTMLSLVLILDANRGLFFSINPLSFLTALYSFGRKTFPSNAMCHFNILNGSLARSYTTACALPASPLLQLLTPLIVVWMMSLAIHGMYRYHGFRTMMSTENQSQFYRRHGFNPDIPKAVSPQTLFGEGGFLLFTTISKSDNANILPRVLMNLRAPLEANPIQIRG